jgi:hypothetical protein
MREITWREKYTAISTRNRPESANATSSEEEIG